jgi:hypothetical protein
MSAQRKIIFLLLAIAVGLPLLTGIGIFLINRSRVPMLSELSGKRQEGKTYTFRHEKYPDPQTMLVGKILSIDYQSRFMTVGEGKTSQKVGIVDQAKFFVLNTKPDPDALFRLKGDHLSELKIGDQVQLSGLEKHSGLWLCPAVVKIVDE